MSRMSRVSLFTILFAATSCSSDPMGAHGTPASNSSGGRANTQMSAVLNQLATLGGKPIETLTPAEARLQPSASDAVIELNQSLGLVAPDRLPPVQKVETTSMLGPGGQPLQLRVYTPSGDGPFPIVVYYHGGGWVIATVDTYDASCRAICALTKAVVVSVEYRKAPENPFPAAPEDCYAAFQYVVDNAGKFNGDAKAVAVAGESAGGNLATVVCLMAKQRGGHMPSHQALIYPVTNDAFDTGSYAANQTSKPLNGAMMQWFFKYYLKSPSDGNNILVSPLRATTDELRGLPPATVVTDEIDPLRDEGIAYAEKLKQAGVDVASKDYTGVTHEFFGMGLVVDEAKSAELLVAGRLRDSFKH